MIEGTCSPLSATGCVAFPRREGKRESLRGRLVGTAGVEPASTGQGRVRFQLRHVPFGPPASSMSHRGGGTPYPVGCDPALLRRVMEDAVPPAGVGPAAPGLGNRRSIR